MTTTTLHSWAEQELRHVDLGDPRRDRRLVRLVTDLADCPESSLPLATGDWAATKAAYRFFDNDHVAPDAIRAAHRQATLDRLPDPAQGPLLVLQDTTLLDFTSHPATTGLGHLIHRKHAGLLVHSALLISATGVPLGVLHQHVWARDPARRGQRRQRRHRPTAPKESQRWLDAVQATEAALPADRAILTIADREADFYDLLATPRRRGHHFLIRAKGRRRVAHEAGLLGDALRAQPVAGQLNVTLPRGAERPARRATRTIQFGAFDLQPPSTHPRRKELAPLRVWAVLAQEENPPPGQKPVCWLLLTTQPLVTLEDAAQAVLRYSRRWLVERLHFVLKSGCRIERWQLTTAARLQRALATYLLVAWRLLWLTYQARQEPEASCATVFTPLAWHVLHQAVQPDQPRPAAPPTLREAVRQVARLGGFLGRRHDGDPGVQVLWRGLRRLHDLVEGYQLTLKHDPRPPTFVGNE
jgi:Transposase DNA-binding/Transposase Tn5 dimerisation domain